MTIAEYIQLKAFARIDGALVALFWIVSFVMYVAGMSSPMLMMAGMIAGIASPFFAAARLKRLRERVLGGTLGFRRAWLYAAHVFFYASLLFAAAQFVYFTFIDKGFLATRLMEVMNEPQTRAMLDANGLTTAMNEAFTELQKMRPIDIALNYLTTNILTGFVLALPVAAYARKQ